MIRASAETCYECLRGENKQKLEVLSFEKAWDKIEKDIDVLSCTSCDPRVQNRLSRGPASVRLENTTSNKGVNI